MLIEEIDETNFREKIAEGEKRVELKIKRFERQIEQTQRAEKEKGVNHKVENEDTIDWYKLFDPTIWAYKVLKDKQNNPLKLRGFQDKIINDKHRFVSTVAANQCGKTWCACVKAIHHAIHVNNASVLVVSRSEPQAIMILDEIKWMMLRANIKFDSVIGDVENRTELHLKNAEKEGVSVIRCLPPTLAVLAYPATLIIPDEEDFWVIDGMTQIEFFQRAIVTRTFETKNWKNNCICGTANCGHFTMGQIFAISNPNMEGGLLYSQYKSPNWRSYRFNFLANPSNTLEEYNQAKEDLPSDIFNSTMAAVFSSVSGGFITEAEWKDAIRDYQLITPARFFLGGDFAGEDTKGRDVDQSMLFGAENIKITPLFSKNTKDLVKVCYFKEFPIRTQKEQIYYEISMFKEQIIKFAYDKVGVGDSVKNDLKERNILAEHQIEALTYSLPNKSEVYYNLKHLFEQRKIIVPNNPKLKEQLLGLRFEKTEGGYIKIHHKTEALKDDWADALANACYVARVLKVAEPYIGITKKYFHSATQAEQGLHTLVCHICEREDYKGQAGYYRGHSPTGLNFAQVPCPRHL